MNSLNYFAWQSSKILRLELASWGSNVKIGLDMRTTIDSRIAAAVVERVDVDLDVVVDVDEWTIELFVVVVVVRLAS